MRAAAPTALAVLLLATPASATAPAPASAPTDPRPPVAARLSGCVTGLERSATFTGSMPAIRGARRMAMRFELHQRTRDGEFRRVDVPGWGWERAEKGRTGFIYSKRVEGLLAPAGYRAVIVLRWYSRSGKVLRDLRRTTPECVQPDPRPDLVHTRLSARAAEPGFSVYEVAVENAGGSPAGGFVVRLASGETMLAQADAGPVAPGARQYVQLRGPRCEPGTMITVLVDPDDAVGEGDEANSYVRPCPAV